MRRVFEQIILDGERTPIPQPSPRAITVPTFPSPIRKAHVLVGMRRSGKTWTMYGHMQALGSRGVPRDRLLFINFEDDRLIEATAADFQAILDAYFGLHPQHADEQDLHFYFDEIHAIPGWEKFIRRLLDQERMHLYLSGSSAKLLAREIASALRGRTYTIEVFPFGFGEYLPARGVEPTLSPASKHKARLQSEAERFLRLGGFPETVFASEEFQRPLLQGYLDVVIYRDIVERYNVTNTTATRELIVHCIRNSASAVSVNKLYHRLRSQGRQVGKTLVYDLLGHLEDAYCIFAVPIHSHSARVQAVNPRKIYAVDPGLITACSQKPGYDLGAQLETAVFGALRRQTEQLAYYRTKSGREVDFVMRDGEGNLGLVQACVSLADPETREREISSLAEAMRELGRQDALIVTLDDEEQVEIGGRCIEVLPFWRWALQQPQAVPSAAPGGG